MNEATPRRHGPPPNLMPIDFETEVGPLPLQGCLPEGLAGTLVRNGPNPLVPDPKAHWFVGDGMLHAFLIEDGQVRYRNRWVQTSRLEFARRTGRNPVPGSNSPQPDGEPFPVDEGAANTNVIGHAGRMLALEEAHLPIAVDLATLETRGVDDFGGGLHGRVTAHPKTDPRTGELLFFGYGTPDLLSRGMSFGVISRDGEVLRQEQFEAPYASMVHDFAVTANHVLFPVMPLTGSRERAQSGRPPYAWEPDHGTRVGLMPRGGSTADIVWWSGPAAYAFHVMNAWEEEGRVWVDLMQFAKPPLFPLPDGSPAGDAREPARLVRWQFDLADPRREFTQTVLAEIPGEFPRIDERRTGLPYRHGWFAGHTPDADGELRMMSRLVHVDHAGPRTEAYTFEGRDRISEPVFVARSAEAAEGDGWILAVAWRAATETSDLVVFDACNVAAGPVCVASLPHRVPDGFHGNWFGATA